MQSQYRFHNLQQPWIVIEGVVGIQIAWTSAWINAAGSGCFTLGLWDNSKIEMEVPNINTVSRGLYTRFFILKLKKQLEHRKEHYEGRDNCTA